jgi:hypothetical protein
MKGAIACLTTRMISSPDVDTICRFASSLSWMLTMHLNDGHQCCLVTVIEIGDTSEHHALISTLFPRLLIVTALAALSQSDYDHICMHSNPNSNPNPYSLH